MPDHLSRALRYRERADECRRLAELATSPEMRGDYAKLAEYYDQLSDAELASAGVARPSEGA